MKIRNPRLYQLLPSHIRKRDAENREPLGEVLSLIADQVDVVEADIDQLYENWFIETCQDWVVPYLGDLIGYSAPGTNEDQEEGGSGQSILPSMNLRRDVANTIRNRKRKGTLALLEEIAHDVASWSARVVEFEEWLLPTQALNHLRLDRGHTLDVRTLSTLERLRGPFDRLARVVDIRTEQPHLSGGRYHPKSVGLFVCRLPTYSVTRTVAYCVEEAGPHCYSFSVLGNDSLLFTAHEEETALTHLAGPLNLPLPIQRGWLTVSTDEYGDGIQTINPEYYGEEKSFAIYATYKKSRSSEELFPPDRIIPADLSQWHYRPPEGYIAVDPELGRMVFPPNQLPDGVLVSYTYGFGADIGGGEYSRASIQGKGPSRSVRQDHGQGNEAADSAQEVPALKRYIVTNNLTEVLEQWRQEMPGSAIIEIQGNHVFEKPMNLALQNQSLEIRAANGKRPIIRLVDWQANRPDTFEITGNQQSQFVMDGILIAGRGLQLKGCFTEVKLSHSTLVPGWSLHGDCIPQRPTEASLTLMGFQGHLCLQKSICGAIRVISGESKSTLVTLSVLDSIIDATEIDGMALGDEECLSAPVVANIQRSTIIGKCWIHTLSLGENSIFLSPLLVERRQQGCLRYCYVPLDSLTPKRFRCQPDLAIAQAIQSGTSDVPRHVRPTFSSLRYGSPWYLQLSQWCGEEITRGAEGEGEMGVFFHRWNSHRASNLIHRVEESVPSGTDVTVIYTT